MTQLSEPIKHIQKALTEQNQSHLQTRKLPGILDSDRLLNCIIDHSCHSILTKISNCLASLWKIRMCQYSD